MNRAPMQLDAARAVVVANMPGMFRRDRRGVDRLARILQSLDVAHAIGKRPMHAELLAVWSTHGWQSSDPAALAAITVAATLRPYATGGTFLNFLADPGRTASAYTAADLRRLRAVKAAYDPDNVFRVGHAITPAADRSEWAAAR